MESLGQKVHKGAQHLRKQLRSDRRAYLDRVVEEAVDAPSREIWKALKPIMPGKKRNGPGQAVPQVLKQDGTKTTTKDEYQN